MDKNILFDKIMKSGNATHYEIIKKDTKGKGLPEYFIQESLGKPEIDFDFSNFLELVHEKLKFDTNHYDDVIYLNKKLPVEEKSLKLLHICILSYTMIDTKKLLNEKKAVLSQQPIINLISRHKFLSFFANKNKINEVKKLKFEIEKLEKTLDYFKEDIDDFIEGYADYSVFDSYLATMVENINIVLFKEDISKLIPIPLDTSKTLYLFDTKKNKVSVVSAVFNGIKSTSWHDRYIEYNLFVDNNFFQILNIMNDVHIKDGHISLYADNNQILFFEKETLKSFMEGVYRKSEMQFKKNMSLVDKMP